MVISRLGEVVDWKDEQEEEEIDWTVGGGIVLVIKAVGAVALPVGFKLQGGCSWLIL